MSKVPNIHFMKIERCSISPTVNSLPRGIGHSKTVPRGRVIWQVLKARKHNILYYKHYIAIDHVFMHLSSKERNLIRYIKKVRHTAYFNFS